MVLSSLRAVVFALGVVVLLSATFHALGFFGAPINVVYSDLLGFYERAVAPGFAYVSKPMEYPVLTGLFIEGAARIGGSRTGYYVVSIFALLAIAIGATRLLYILTPPERRRRLWRYWIFAPSMFVFATYNWDLIAILFSVAAFYAVSRERRNLAAFFLALGFAAKFYPALYLLPLLLSVPSWRERVKLAGIFVATALAVNFPFMLLNFDGWSYFFTLNSVRNSNPDSIWTIARFFFRGLDVVSINMISLVLFAAGYAGMLWKFRRAPMLYLCFGATLLFLLTNKIFSPQYVLWLLPFFVLVQYKDYPLSLSKGFYILEFSNLATFFTILPWFFFGNDIFYFYMASPFVVMRHVALIMIAIGLYKSIARTPMSGRAI